MENQEPTNRNLIQSRVSRRTALKAGGIAALGLAFSKPLIQTIYPQPAFAQLSSAGLPGNDTTPDPQGQPLIAGCNPNNWVLGSEFSILTPVRALAVTNTGYIYAAADDMLVQKFDPSGSLVAQWGGVEGSGNGQFDEGGSSGVAVSPLGKVYVLDNGNNRVQIFDPNGNFLGKWGSFGTGNGQFDTPRGIVIDSAGNVYVSEDNHRIQKFNSAGGYLGQWGTQGSGDGQFNGPDGIAVDTSGNVYVSDKLNHRIQKFAPDGTFITKWGTQGTGDGQFNRPAHIAVDGSGHVYVRDYKLPDGRVQIFDSNGAYLNKIEGSSALGNGIALSSGCTLYLGTSYYEGTSFKLYLLKYVQA